MSLLARVVSPPDVVGGRPRVAGTRVRVSDVLGMLVDGATADEIVEDYPYLSHEDIAACLEFAAVQSDHSILVAS